MFHARLHAKHDGAIPGRRNPPRATRNLASLSGFGAGSKAHRRRRAPQIGMV